MQILDELRKQKDARQAGNWRAYRELLMRGNAPQPGDGEELARLMAELVRTEADIARDAGLVVEAAAAAAEAAGLDEADSELAEVQDEIARLAAAMQAELDGVTGRHETKLAPARERRRVLRSVAEKRRAARIRLNVLRGAHPRLFNGDGDSGAK